jgi:hypothetical protein
VELNPHQRRWLDIDMRGLALGLALGPLLPGALGGLVLMAMDKNPTVGELLAAFVGTLLVAEIWWIGGSLAYLLPVPRRRGRITRRECLLLGTILGGVAPLFSVLIVTAIGALVLSPAYGYGDYLSYALPDLLFSLVAGLVWAPFGLFGGWLLWRIAVRPAGQIQRGVHQVFE